MNTPDSKPVDIPITGRPSSDTMIWLPRAAAVTGCAYFLAHSLRVIFGSESKLMEWLYDDSFYYMITAMHFSERHISSFDGVTVTSGYHPLWMWLCAAVYGLRGRLDLTYVRSCMALTLCISGVILLLALRDAWIKRHSGMLWALGLGACSYSALNNGLTVMEWPLVVLCWFLLHGLLLSQAGTSHGTRQLQAKGYAAALVLGIAGSLSRTDFGLIPASYLAAAILLALPRRNWDAMRLALMATLGALLGLPLVFWYNHRMTGAWLQSSAEVKRLAASLSSPFNPIPALWQFLRVLLYLPALDLAAASRTALLHRALGALLLLIVVGAIFTLVWTKRTRLTVSTTAPRNVPEEFALIAALFGVTGYLLLDGFNTQATYGWYTAAVTGFIFIVTARVFATLRTPVAGAIVLPLMLANMAAAEWFGGNARSQMQEITTGKALHLGHPAAVMGGGDVGKPSFYNHGEMFNLDGLMNNEVVPYLAAGRIHCYILSRHIEYLSDVGSITLPVTDSERLKRNEPPIPWGVYFVPVYGRLSDGSNDLSRAPLYFRTDFSAIRASGECSN